MLSGKVLWSYDWEVSGRDAYNDFAHHFGIPFHKHVGEIILTDEQLIISGDEELNIPLNSMAQIALGFDENFPATLVKNFGLFWQPLRITLQSGQNLYLIIDFNILLGPAHAKWFNTLKEMLAE